MNVSKWFNTWKEANEYKKKLKAEGYSAIHAKTWNFIDLARTCPINVTAEKIDTSDMEREGNVKK